jgi:hypothetical protein
VFLYLPIGQLIKAMFAKVHIARLIEWESGYKDPIRNTGIWNQRIKKDTFFMEGDHSHNLVFAFSTDGFNPWGDMDGASYWPLILINLNLPFHLRYRPEFILLIGLIPVHPSSLQPFIRIMVDELNGLYRNGINAYCSNCSKRVLSKCRLLFTISDYPALADITGQTHFSGRRGCAKCNISVSIIYI